jgi:CRISPR/Cas system Type II protein with McrA/HNH and RuvC-like nuclease domain
MNKENVLGLDLGISSIGWALLNKNNIKEGGALFFLINQKS